MSGNHVAYLRRVHQKFGVGCDKDAFDVVDAILKSWMEFMHGEESAVCAKSRFGGLRVGPRLEDHVNRKVETQPPFYPRNNWYISLYALDGSSF